MKLNVEKCKIIHFERANKRGNYYVEDTTGKWSELSKSDIEMLSEVLSWGAHIDNVVKRANIIRGMLIKKFYSSNTSSWRNLLVSLVRPRLD